VEEEGDEEGNKEEDKEEEEEDLLIPKGVVHAIVEQKLLYLLHY
jgi:hypothetical protein